MIRAVADYAEGYAKSPPPDLVNALTSKTWGLPYAGGWQEQPAGLFPRMQAAYSVYTAVRSWKRATNWTKWQRENPDGWKIVQQVIKMRRADGESKS